MSWEIKPIKHYVINLIIMKKILFFCFLLSLVACETKEDKINKAKEAVSLFITSTNLENFDDIYTYYPTAKEMDSFWKLNDFKVTNTIVKDEIVIIIGIAGKREIYFELKKEKGNYIITKTKGLSIHFDSKLYTFCKNIGCIPSDAYDVEISKVCKKNKFLFDSLVTKIKNNIESNVGLVNMSASKEPMSSGIWDRTDQVWVRGNIEYKNLSKYTIPSSTYNLYVNFLDKNKNILLRKKEYAYGSISFGESNTISLSEMNLNDKVEGASVSLEITDTDFIEDIIAKYAKGDNCKYSYNL